jgi:putative transposase
VGATSRTRLTLARRKAQLLLTGPSPAELPGQSFNSDSRSPDAFPWDTAPRFLLRDRDSSYGPVFSRRVEVMGITEVITAPRSPWQNPYVERAIGSTRRECLDHLIVFNERHLRRVLSSYRDYYHHTRTHLSLMKDCPAHRPVRPPTRGNVIAIPQVGGLHHRYERLAA